MPLLRLLLRVPRARTIDHVEDGVVVISYESEFFFFERSQGTCSEGCDDGTLGEGFVGFIPEGVEVSFFTKKKVSDSGYGIIKTDEGACGGWEGVWRS